MQRDSDHSPTGLDPAWERACIEILRGNRKGVDLYRSRTIKERLMDAMAWPNTNALVKTAKGTGRMTLRDVAGRLCLDDRTLERWQKGVVQPHPRTFFGLLYVGLRKEVVDVAYPDSRDVLWDAVTATLRMNRAKELRQRTRRPRRDEFVLVRQLLRHPRADLFAPSTHAQAVPPTGAEIERVLAQVIKEARGRADGPSLANPAAALSAIGDWALPYALFRFGLPFELGVILEALDDHAV